MNTRNIQLSKSLSWLLRHGAVEEGFKLSPEGYLEVNKILQHKTFRGKYNTTDVERVVANNDKQRFKLRHHPDTGVLEIKATQGHTITQVTVAELTPILEPKYTTVIHGTYLKSWTQIKNEGVSRMKRKHVHLSKGLLSDDTVISGLRRNAEVHIYIDLPKALADGLKFYESENGVILTSGNDKGYLEPKYFTKVVNFRTGYPPYTQQQDLIHAFSKMGGVKVERCNSRSAVLSYSTEKESKAAVEANKRISIYGQFLSVKPYTAKMAAEDSNRQQTPKRNFTRTKQKSGMIVEPKQLDLSGDFHTQLDTIMAAVRLTQEDVAALSTLYTDLEAVLQTLWPGCSAIPFGSITTGLGVKTSDADCFINVPPQLRLPNANFVNKTKRALQQYPDTFAEILSIPRANTPIVKFFHIPTETNCDVSFKTPLGVQNSKLIAFLLHADPRLIPVAVAVKYWAKVHDLSGTGKLTNYALTMLIIFYLQQPPMSILPSVASLQRDPTNDWLVDLWNTGFMGQRSQLPPCTNTSSISELLGGFFEYYSMFNFEEMVVCPYLGVPVKKEAFKNPESLPEEFERYKSNVMNNFVLPLRYSTSFCVQDPFEQCHNVASTITTKLASDIKSYFKFAANAYEKAKLSDCDEFLKVILLQKPKIMRTKTHPEYRVNLFPRIVSTIIDPDWKSIVRKLVMTIFDGMLKIKLGKVEEKVNPDTKKEKEKYMGNVTKPIWKRKRFAALYSMMKISFEEKQGKITEEIMTVDKQMIGLQFQLTLTYCHEPKSALVAIRMGGGDLDAFREFGKFFISVMQSWFVQLLKPYSRPITKDTATKIAETIEVLDSFNDIETDDDEDESSVNANSQTTEVNDNAGNDATTISLNNNDASTDGVESSDASS